MLGSPDPLGERLTLMWHDHFATAQSKVDRPRADAAPERHLPAACPGPVRLSCSNASVREPALLLYLDAPSNRKDHPNENLARELMELFTLGVGNFTEADVKEAARALDRLDGRRWRVSRGPVAARRRRENLARPQGAVARLRPSFDLARPARDRPHGSPSRLCGLFMGERAVDEPATVALAGELSASRLDIGHAVETVLRSRAFFASENIRSRVIGPVEFVIGACRALVPAPVNSQHAASGRLDGPARSATVRAPQCRRLARGSGVADSAVAGRPGQFRRGPGRRPPDRPAGAARRRLDRRRARARKLGATRSGKPHRRYCSGSSLAIVTPQATRSPDAARKALATLLASPEAQIG